jgi:hypothetical protein
VIVPRVSFSQRRRERKNDQKDRCGEKPRYGTSAGHIPIYHEPRIADTDKNGMRLIRVFAGNRDFHIGNQPVRSD